jgi:FtsH-binding integral membrane protein
MQLSIGLLPRVFFWQATGVMISMSLGLLLAAIPGYINAIMYTKWLLIAIVFGPMGVVGLFNWRVQAMSYAETRTWFVGYAALIGLMLSLIFPTFRMSSIFACFGIAAGMCGFMAIYGYTMQADLSGWGSFLAMGAVGLFGASLVNLFMGNPLVSYIISYGAILVFTAMTAYDVQKFKKLGAEMLDDEDMNKWAVIGGWRLYTSFINVFISLLRLFGRRA